MQMSAIAEQVRDLLAPAGSLVHEHAGRGRLSFRVADADGRWLYDVELEAVPGEIRCALADHAADHSTSDIGLWRLRGTADDELAAEFLAEVRSVRDQRTPFAAATGAAP